MTFVPALALVTLLAAGDPLTEAQRAFAQGQYPEAEALAQQAARPPTQGAALYLVGLARFRAGRPAEALEALEAAALAEDAPPRAAWSFNRGACLYALGRFEEAEGAFAEASADPALAAAAWVNAGFAALDAGAPERAAQWADRAAPGPSEAVAAQVEELRALITVAQGGTLSEAAEAYRQGLAAFDAERFDEARALFLRSAELEPGSGRARLMAGASAYRQGARAVAREDVTASLALPLEPRDRATAHQYLDRLSFGLRASGPGSRLAVLGGLGFDSNVPQYGVAEYVSTGSDLQTASAFADVGLGVSLRLRLSDQVFAHVSYSGSQRAYSQDSLEDYALQLHRVSAAVEWEAARRVRLGGAVSGDVFFTGMSDFRGLQSSVGGQAWLAVDESEWTSTRVDLTLARKDGLVSEFSYLTGTRLDATLSQELRLPALSATAWYRYREDRIGTLVQEGSSGFGPPPEYVIPFAWAGHAAGTSLRLAPIGRFDASLDAEVERRFYQEDSFVRVQPPEGPEEERGRRRRRDTRFTLGSSVSARLTELLQLTARYELLVNHSNVDTRLSGDHRDDYTNGNYQKHVLTLELGASW